MTETFKRLSSLPTKECVKELMPMIERFVALTYKQTTDCFSVNKVRQKMSAKDGRDLENITPTAAALF